MAGIPIGPGEYNAIIYPQGSSVVSTGPLELNFVSRNLYVIVLAGSTEAHSIELVGPITIRRVF